MKKQIIPILATVSALALLSGCAIDLSFGGGKKDSTSTSNTTNNSATSNNQRPVVDQTVQPTIGQQLIDLKKAKDTGAITDAEYEAQKAKLLGNK